MHLLLIGLNHKTARLELREKLALHSNQPLATCNHQIYHQALRQLLKENPAISEGVILSTCNRLEFYLYTAETGSASQAVIQLISQVTGIEQAIFETNLYQIEDADVVSHLMRVASGLDSMVLGEAEILGQVVNAHQMALDSKISGKVLARLFEMAVHTGKRARTETNIGINRTSISSVAVEQAEQSLNTLTNKTVVVLGAGKMSKLTLQSLAQYPLKQILLVNRSIERAEALAKAHNALPLGLEALDSALIEADALIAATGAPKTIINADQIQRVMSQRPHRLLALIDIALPRNIQPDVSQIPNVQLHNLDQLKAQIADNLKVRQAEIPKVEAIIAAEQKAFLEWQKLLVVVPTITTFRKHFESIRQKELKRTLNRLQNLEEREQEIIAEMTQRLLNRFLHSPTIYLRAEASRGNGYQSSSALKELFALDIDECH